MAKAYLRPRRGKKSTAEAQLTSSRPLKRGEVFFEVPDEGVGTGIGKIKMGDGETAYTDLPYFMESGSGGGGIGQDITISLNTAGWTSETISGETYYVQTSAAAGATSNTVPVIVPIYSTDTEMEAYTNIIRVEPSTNALKFIALDRPSINLTVVAKFAVESTADLDVITREIGRDITQAEYDALSPEEQATGVYFITDAVGGEITLDDSLSSTSNNAVRNKVVTGAINQINNDLTASDNLKFEFSYDQATGKHGYLDSQGTFVPFKSPTGNKDITISNTGTTSGIDVADYATASITTSGLYKPSGTKYIYSNGTYDVTSYASASVSVSASLSETTLWTNPSPSNTFAGQTVSLNSSIDNFSYIKVYGQIDKNNTTPEITAIFSVSSFKTTRWESANCASAGLLGRTSTNIYIRPMVYDSSTTIKILIGYGANFAAGSSVGNAAYIIPTKITGLK